MSGYERVRLLGVPRRTSRAFSGVQRVAEGGNNPNNQGTIKLHVPIKGYRVHPIFGPRLPDTYKLNPKYCHLSG